MKLWYKSMKQKQRNKRERIFKMKVLLAPASGELGTVELSMAPVQGCGANKLNVPYSLKEEEEEEKVDKKGEKEEKEREKGRKKHDNL